MLGLTDLYIPSLGVSACVGEDSTNIDFPLFIVVGSTNGMYCRSTTEIQVCVFV